MSTDRNSSSALAISILIGLVLGSAILGWFLKDIRKTERYVTVKGFAERDVKSDLAVWPIKVVTAGDDLSEVTRVSEQNRNRVLQFLMDKGFKPEEIVNQRLSILDRQAGEHGTAKDKLRYVAEFTLVVRSNDVDLAGLVSQRIDELVNAGVIVGSRGGDGLKYIYTGLNSIKPDMLAEATRNARAAAKQFALDSGSSVGAIRRASQGLFSINDWTRAAGEADGGDAYYYSGVSDVNKKVRVVLTVDYLLEG